MSQKLCCCSSLIFLQVESVDELIEKLKAAGITAVKA